PADPQSGRRVHSRTPDVRRAYFTKRPPRQPGRGATGQTTTGGATPPQRPRGAPPFPHPPPIVSAAAGAAPGGPPPAEVLDELGITDVAVIGLAKRLEEVWVPGESDPVIMPRNSEALFLLQRVRDEAHRFAITFHRSKRSRRMTASALDSVPGLGAARRTALVTHFGSVAKLKEATVEQITEVPGIGLATAKAVLAALQEG
ncbi:helix-hairpin-helix domain-containing protein, partial [Nocardia brasiliensis]|uniref:helix-hairpin-helix domain-containing protein n=1 Tax=Nocardia brasiliensis TaxID=37326 RepID=UPI003CC8089F